MAARQQWTRLHNRWAALPFASCPLSGVKRTSATKKFVTAVSLITSFDISGRRNAISTANIQKHQGDPDCPQTQTACNCAYRDHYRMAPYFDRSLHRRRHCRAELSRALHDKDDEVPRSGAS